MIARELLEGIGGYTGLFFFCVGSGWILPVPEDVALLYAGMRIEEGEALWLPTTLVAIAGVLVRDGIAYGIGRGLGDLFIDHPTVLRMVGPKRVARSRRLVEAQGSRAVMIGRFLVGLRAPVFMACGAARMPFGWFLLWDFLGLLVAVPLAMILGYFFGAPLVDGLFWVLASVRPAGVGLLLILLVGSLAWVYANRDVPEV